MNTYEFTWKRENGTTGTGRITAATEAQARRDFKEVYRHGNGTITSVKHIADNAPATKEQERKALAQIKKIIDKLGKDSYIGTAFEGCFEIAEDNIKNDFANSMKQRAEKAEEEAHYFHGAADNFVNMVEAEREKIAALKQRILTDDDLTDIWHLVCEKLHTLDEDIKSAEENIIKYAELPSSQEFIQAVKDHRNAKSNKEYYSALLERVQCCKAAKH